MQSDRGIKKFNVCSLIQAQKSSMSVTCNWCSRNTRGHRI